MMRPLELAVWELLCVTLLYSVFCRLVRTDKTTRLSVRLSIFGLGIAALIGIGAPLYAWTPDFVSMCITAATVVMQLVAARHWRKGVPVVFITPHKGCRHDT